VLDVLRDDQMVELAILIGATQMLNHFCTAFDVPPTA
jgi:alkylhydroperoxidase family enzyme